ncbi:hypothetical protein AK812_SmicGene14293 [Symbiodinium microadriaticum]|uniref:J domain-containing protein n=1 Tax=Symbiodinium microadriaticum TaxID=2951 RepID=A0A1Q9E5X9_SYMMI|nr:hypothetical protein AK812_SmicGene14293 [Symbiodinium microadriaticum]
MHLHLTGSRVKVHFDSTVYKSDEWGDAKLPKLRSGRIRRMRRARCYPPEMRRGNSDYGFPGDSLEATPSYPSCGPGAFGGCDGPGCGFKGMGGFGDEQGCKGPCQGKGCHGGGGFMQDPMWMMGPNGVPCAPMGPAFHLPATSQEQGKGPPPYHADDSVEDRDFYQQNYQPYYRSADRWKGNSKGGKKGGKGKGYEELDRFDRLSPQERKRQWDAQCIPDLLNFFTERTETCWHPCAGAFKKKLLDAKSKLKKIDLVVGAGGRERGSPRKGQKQRGRQQREQVPVSADEPPAFQAKWFVHAPSQQDSRQPFDIEEKSNAGFLGRQKSSDTDLAPDLREIQLKVKGTVPAGCLLKVHMNGRDTELKPEIRSKRGEVLPAESHQETTFHVRRPEPEPETFEAVADLPSAAACPRGGLSFVPSVEFDACAMVARTDIKLLTPTIELVEVHDTAVVLSLRNLTGQRFELTVYASGAEAPGVASTLVQCGPVRGAESVHRISPLEASQVYVAWVKVFSDTKTAESKQKGFKTLEAKEKTIWDEKDHVILGVSEDATTKEIVKAWRSKSLQYHPDKVPDEQKEEAEEMMKRLNLAKQNMMKFAKVTPEQDAASATAEAAQEDDEDDPSFDAEGGPSQPPPEFDDADSDKASSSAGAQKAYSNPKKELLRGLWVEDDNDDDDDDGDDHDGECRRRDCDDGADEEDAGHGNDYAVFMAMSNNLTIRTRVLMVLKFADTVAVGDDDDDDKDAIVDGDDGHEDKFEAAVNMTAMTSIGDDTDDNGDDRDEDAACGDDGDNRGHNAPTQTHLELDQVCVGGLERQYALWSQTGASGEIRKLCSPYMGVLYWAINKTVRDLRLYQGRLQCYENLKAMPSMEELLALEEQIKDLDRELFGIVEEDNVCDLQKIFFHVRQSEATVESALSRLQEQDLVHSLVGYTTVSS